jgi:hypothetical protein
MASLPSTNSSETPPRLLRDHGATVDGASVAGMAAMVLEPLRWLEAIERGIEQARGRRTASVGANGPTG